VFSCLFQKTCLAGISLIGSSTTCTRYVKTVKFTTMGSSGKDLEILCFWPFTPCRSIFAQNLRDESWSHMCVYSHLWTPDSVILNSIFGFGGKVDRRSFETCSSHLSPRNEPMKTSFYKCVLNTYNYIMALRLT
jgi:hypothetical protein